MTHFVVNLNLLKLTVLDVGGQFSCFIIKLSCIRALSFMQLYILTDKLLISAQDVIQFSKLIWVLVFYCF